MPETFGAEHASPHSSPGVQALTRQTPILLAANAAADRAGKVSVSCQRLQ